MRFLRLAARAFLVTTVGMSFGTLTSQTASAAGQAETLTLEQAIARAMTNEPAFAATKAERQALALERTDARAALLPTVTYHNEAIYTNPNGVPASRIGQTAGAPAPAFIANNAVREYVSQGVFSETLGLGQVGAIRLADANAARADAELEIARRGLVTTVVTLYLGLRAGSDKVTTSQQAVSEADRFVDITEKREAAREAAHADVLKAQLLQQQRQRELADAHLAQDKARLELAVVLYADPDTPFSLAPPSAPPMLPARDGINALGGARTIRSCAAPLLCCRRATPKHTIPAPLCFRNST
jgi:outer membrane protein TolC